MEISGNWLIPADKERLDEWRESHSYSFAGFREDAALPDNWFRTAGEFLCLATNVYRQAFGDRGPQPD